MFRFVFSPLFVVVVDCSCVRAYALLDRGRLTPSDEGTDWPVDPLHISQLKEQYRRDRAKNKKGLLSRKLKIVLIHTDERHQL